MPVCARNSEGPQATAQLPHQFVVRQSDAYRETVPTDQSADGRLRTNNKSEGPRPEAIRQELRARRPIGSEHGDLALPTDEDREREIDRAILQPEERLQGLGHIETCSQAVNGVSWDRHDLAFGKCSDYLAHLGRPDDFGRPQVHRAVRMRSRPARSFSTRTSCAPRSFATRAAAAP